MKSAEDKERIARAVESFQRGIDREQSFRVLFDQYYGLVQGFFAQRVRTYEDRLDLTQETFLRVYKGLEGYRKEADFGTWLFRIAFNTHLKWLRRSQGEEAKVVKASRSEPDAGPPGGEPVAASPSPLDDALRHEQRHKLREAIAALPDQMRRCTRLRVDQDLSYREIAAVLKLSIETVKVHLFQARKRLKLNLREAFTEIDL